MNPQTPITQVAIPISVRNQNSRPVIITHSEYYGSIVTTSTTFTLSKDIVVQPGLNVSFPWLSTIAQNFDRYQLLNLELEYIPACPTSTGGTVYMAFDPDALDFGPIQTSDMLQYKSNIQFSPFLAQRLKVPTSLFKRILYTRTAAQNIGNGDLKTYDAGLLYVATDMTATGVSLGTIKLVYTVQLMDPQPRSDGYIGASCLYTGNATNLLQAVQYNTSPVIFPSVLNGNILTVKAAGLYYIHIDNSSSTALNSFTYSSGLSGTTIVSLSGTFASANTVEVLALNPGTITFGNIAGAALTMIVKIA
jgi:hypothetical protein